MKAFFLCPEYHFFSLSEILLGNETIDHFEDVDGQRSFPKGPAK